MQLSQFIPELVRATLISILVKHILKKKPRDCHNLQYCIFLFLSNSNVIQ